MTDWNAAGVGGRCSAMALWLPAGPQGARRFKHVAPAVGFKINRKLFIGFQVSQVERDWKAWRTVADEE